MMARRDDDTKPGKLGIPPKQAKTLKTANLRDGLADLKDSPPKRAKFSRAKSNQYKL
jgi:hypothetical protein